MVVQVLRDPSRRGLCVQNTLEDRARLWDAPVRGPHCSCLCEGVGEDLDVVLYRFLANPLYRLL